MHENWKQLVVSHQVSGKEAHDAGHVATMLAHGLKDVLTFDLEDFRRYEQLVNAWRPRDILARARDG